MLSLSSLIAAIDIERPSSEAELNERRKAFSVVFHAALQIAADGGFGSRTLETFPSLREIRTKLQKSVDQVFAMMGWAQLREWRQQFLAWLKTVPANFTETRVIVETK